MVTVEIGIVPCHHKAAIQARTMEKATGTFRASRKMKPPRRRTIGTMLIARGLLPRASPRSNGGSRAEPDR
jgi:hypothetical protein